MAKFEALEGDAQPQASASSKKAVETLRQYLGDAFCDEELQLWISMSERQRAAALQRMAAITRWLRGVDPQDVKLARADAGINSDSRFYEMAAAFSANPSLKTLGVLATAPRKRKRKNEDKIVEKVRAALDARSGESVRQIALAIQNDSAFDTPPSYNTLRRYIDEEMRRRSRKARPGRYVGLDCCDCSMVRMDGSEYTLFAIIDRETQLILGAALGDAVDSGSGYGAAAADAIDRLDRPPLRGIAWLHRVEGFQVVVGFDRRRWEHARREFREVGISAPVEPSLRPRRFGRYLREAAGPRVGRIAMTPIRTEEASDRTTRRAPTPDDVRRLALEVDNHNQPRIDGLEIDAEGAVPADLVKLLQHLSSQ